jgi:hypothetical protein
MKEDDLKNYGKYYNLTFDEWFEELKAWGPDNGFPFDPETLDKEAWREYYDEGYAPGVAMLEDLTNGV